MSYSEKLYLCKGNNNGDVFIPTTYAQHLKSFQRDGIRFLLRQYRKKKAGAILNDPAECGKKVQTVLLLDSLRADLAPLASLVLCGDHERDLYKHHFHLWTDCAEDTVSDSNNVFVKKSIILSSVKNINALAKRDWGIVVVDDYTAIQYMKHLKTLKAKFKIWVTSEDLKDNLQDLSMICEWIDPKYNFNISSYTPDGNGRDAAEKAIKLSILCEDIVVRSVDGQIPLQKKQVYKKIFGDWLRDEKNVGKESYFSGTIDDGNNNYDKVVSTCNSVKDLAEADAQAKPLKSRKNKDASGLKVKRSKKIKLDQEPLGRNDVSSTDSAMSTESNQTTGINSNEKKVDDANAKGTISATHLKQSITDQKADSLKSVLEEVYTNTKLSKMANKINHTANMKINEVNLDSINVCENHRLENNDNEEQSLDKLVSITTDGLDFGKNTSTFLLIDKVKIDNMEVCEEDGLRNEVNTKQSLVNNIKLVNYAKVADFKAHNNVTPFKENSQSEIMNNRDTIDKSKLSEKCTIGSQKANDIKSTIEQLEKSTYNQFKGSVLDSLF